MHIQSFLKTIKLTVIISTLSVPVAPKEHNWDWEKIDAYSVKKLAKKLAPSFPKEFNWGVALAEYQNSGAKNCPHSDWSLWEKDGHILNKEQSGASCDHWNKIKQDIELIKNLGLNACRFSVEWSTIEPQEGKWDLTALQHYVDEVKALRAANIKPMITLLHFSKPQWFADKGGFEKEKNIKYFVRFCKKVFKELNPHVSLWCTINEPTIEMFSGYWRETFPPGKCNLTLGGTVLKNLLIAHTRVYTALKKLPGGKNTQIGIVHQHLKFKPLDKNSATDSKAAQYLTHVSTEAAYSFFKTGQYRFKVVPKAESFFKKLSNLSILPEIIDYSKPTITYNDPSAPQKIDFIGLNYYSVIYLNKNSIAYRPKDIITDMPYAINAEGLYQAIVDMSDIGKHAGKNIPIYITENGISDERDDGRRKTWIKRHMFALSRALLDGYNVRGFYYWTLMDNFEWDSGTTQHFGLYTKNRELRKGSKAYMAFTKQNTD